MRKKFTMLFASLFLFLGTIVAQSFSIEDLKQLEPEYSSAGKDYRYYIRNVRDNEYYVAIDNEPVYDTSEDHKGYQLRSAKESSTSKSKVEFKLLAGENDTVKIVAVGVDYKGEELYLRYRKTDEGSTRAELCVDDEQNNWTLEKHNEGGYAIIANNKGNSLNMYGGAGANIGLFRKGDSGSNWVFEPANDNAMNAAGFITVTYKYEYNDTVLKTVEKAQFPNSPYAAPEFDFVTFTNPDGTVSEENKEITLECTINLPFNAVADVDSIKDWYHLKFHATGQYYLYYDDAAEGDVLDATETSVDAMDKDAYSWAFVGNPFDGFKVYNKEAEMYLNAGDNGAVVGATAQDFILTKSSHAENGFFMQAKDGNKTDRFNRQNGKVAYWGNADAGSTFMVELRDDSQALIDLVKKAQEFIDQQQGETVGYITANSKGAISSAIEEAKAAIGSNNTVILAAQDKLQKALDAAKTIQPEAGKFYYIASAMPGNGYCSGQKMYVNAEGGMQFETAENKMGNIFQFKSAGEGKFYLYNVERDAYLNTNKGHGGGQAKVGVQDEAKAVTITNMGKENVVKIVPVGGAMLHAQEWGSRVVAYNVDGVNDASAWKIVEVEAESLKDFAYNLNIDDYKYMTLFLNYSVAIPEGVDAYAVTGVADDNELQMDTLTGVVPAQTAVVVYAKTAGDYAFKYTATAGDAPAGNCLKGSLLDTYVKPEGTPYVMTLNANNEVVMGKAKLTDDSKIKNRANKAYLDLPVAAGAAMYSFNRGEGTTSIDNSQLTIDNAKLTIYDITGRRVEKMEKGIYIVNGKKVVIK